MIIGIESSCDESAIALFDEQRGVVAEWIHSQIARHQEYGGIVPDIASREHLEHFPVLAKKLAAVHEPVSGDSIAVTIGPGLAGSLAMGMAFARSLTIAYGLPLIGVNHLRGHAFSPFISLHADDPAAFHAMLQDLLPHIGLIVSGGNTLLFQLDSHLHLSILAGTVDDAAGEALDKGAKLLGMPYPGGPLIETLATDGSPAAFEFPRSFAHSPEPRFSFSGLKTSMRYQLEKMTDGEVSQRLPDLCASYQQAVVDALVLKTRQFLRRQTWKSVGLSGGVSNNRTLRAAFTSLCQRHGLPLLIAEPRHTGDNAAMIAFAAFVDPAGCVVEPREFLPAWELA